MWSCNPPLGADTASFAFHKVGGPKRAGLLAASRPGLLRQADRGATPDVAAPEWCPDALVSVLRENAAVAMHLSPDTLDPDRPLSEYGLDSLVGVELVLELEQTLDVTIDVTALQGATLRSFAAHLGELVAAKEVGGETHRRAADKMLIPLNDGPADAAPLFLIHPISGSALPYTALARSLAPHRRVYGLQAPSVAGVDVDVASIGALADTYLARIAEHHVGPLLLGGWSLGGVVAYEMARRRKASGEETPLLAIIDARAPTGDVFGGSSAEQDRFLLRLLARDLGLPADEAQLYSAPGMTLTEGMQAMVKRAKELALIAWNYRIADLRRRFGVFRAHLTLLEGYAPDSYDGPIALYRAEEPLPEHRGDADDMGWAAVLADAPEVTHLAGDHFTLLEADGGLAADLIRRSAGLDGA